MHTLALICLCLLAAIMPWEENFIIPYVVSGARILGVGVLALGILKVVFTGKIRVPPLPMYFFAMFVGWCFLASNWSLDSERTITRSTTYALLFAFIWLTWEFADTPRRQKMLMRAFIIGTAILIFNVYLNQIGMGLQEARETRATVDAANPNGVAAACCIACQFALYLITRREKGQFELPDWLYWGFIAAAAIAIPMTGSRAGFLSACCAALSFYPVLRKATQKSGWKNAMMLAILVAVMGIAIPRLVSSAILARVAEGTDAYTFQTRVDAWERGLREWSKTPMLGVGPACYSIAGLASGEKERAAHNTFVSVLVETGLVGAVLYFAFWVLAIRRVLRTQKADRYFWLVFLLSLLPIMITSNDEAAKSLWLIGALVLCQSANPQATRVFGRRPAPSAVPKFAPVVPVRRAPDS
jgi:O-antigen ligase